MKKRKWLTSIRKEKNLSLRDLAPIVKVSYPYLSDIERGRRNPSGRLAYELSKVLDFDMNKFFEEEEKEKTTA